jgi:hypothetical protein
MTLRTKVAEALGRELLRQEFSTVARVEGATAHVSEEGGGTIDLEALADAALEARKRWHRATDPSAK